MKTLLSALALACVSNVAFAQYPSAGIGKRYDAEDTLTQVSDGLYARVGDDGASYVATTPAGQRALLEKLVAIRDATPASHGPMRPGYAREGFFDDIIATLSADRPKNQDVFGDCTGPHDTGPLRVQALAGGGFAGSTYGASAMTTNATSPIVNTTNFASAAVYDVDHVVLSQQTSTQYGATSAVATAYNAARGCFADSKATITCPGHTTPSVVAIATNRRQFPTQCVVP